MVEEMVEGEWVVMREEVGRVLSEIERREIGIPRTLGVPCGRFPDWVSRR